MFLYHLLSPISEAYCTDITDPDAEPPGDIVYGVKVQKQCTMRNGDVITLERECGYNHFLNEYVTSGDSFVCPGVYRGCKIYIYFFL